MKNAAKKVVKKAVIVSTAIACMGTTVFAAHPLVSDDAGTLGKGNMQIELNGDISSDRETADGSTTKTFGKQLATSFGVGVTDKIDIAVGFARPWGNGNTDDIAFKDAGSADFSLTMKWQAWEHEGFSVAVKPQLGYSYAVGVAPHDHTTSYGATMILSKEIEALAFHLNAGYNRNQYDLEATRDASRSDIWSFSLATTYEVIKNLKLVADVGGATNENRADSTTQIFAVGGFIYAVNKNLDLSSGIKVGLSKPENDLTGTLGATIKF